MRRSLPLLASLVAFGAVGVAHAQKPRPVSTVIPAGAGQPAMAVGFDEHGALFAKVCKSTPCTLAGGESLELPPEAVALSSRATLTVMRVAKARRVVSAEIPDPAHSRSWMAVFAAPVDGSEHPKILFRGWTGLLEGEFGLRHGPLVQRGTPNADGTYSIAIGEQREDLTLCGRPAILSPKLIDSGLALRPAKVQRLPESERNAAREVVAQRLPEDSPKSGYSLLRAVAATSAVGNPTALTDGDPNTTWAENRGAEGRGEFVLMDAPSQLPLTGFELVVRPPGKEPDKAVAPSDFWLATRNELVHVTLPDDAWKYPGARWEIRLDKPLQSDCLALVTEGATHAGRDSRVTFAELSARTEFDATAVDGLVGALAGGGERAEAAGDALRALGSVAVKPIEKAWDALDEGGRRVALAVIDQVACSESAPLYVRALLGPYRAHRVHARDRLRRCGAEAAPVLVESLKKASPRARPMLAAELSVVGPEDAVREIVPLLAQADAPARRLLRKALAFATRNGHSTAEVKRLLADPSLAEVAAVDLLRALGDRATELQPEAGRALARLATPSASFRTRYLLLGPASALAGADAGARAILARAITTDPSGHVRAEAAHRVPDVKAFQGELTRALSDPEVRVREAALVTLQRPSGSFASRSVAKLLLDDRWPLVRSAAAVALSQHAADPSVDAALEESLDDASREVRAPAVLALGERRAIAHADAVRARLEDGDEDIGVRTNAAIALGLMCDSASLDVLTDQARRLRDPGASPEARALAPVALGALGRIHPPDLQRRLGPLLDEGAPPLARRAALATLREPGGCGRRATTR